MEHKTSIHKSVLLQETIDGLNLRPGATIVDGTFGGGGHSQLICSRFSGVKIIALDQDKGVWDRNKTKFDKGCDISFVNKNFRDVDQVLKDLKIEFVDGVMLDLGLSSDQLENSGRGFSFMIDEPLLMTMKENPSPEDLTALDVVNTWGEDSLADIIYGYGEEQFSRRIAKGIVEARKRAQIKTTFDLVKIINDSVPNFYKKGKINPSTKTFQALRIAVNDELGALTLGLERSFQALGNGGRLAIISFHSLEDRIVKRFFKNKEVGKLARLINKKPITPSSQELKDNKRSRSAKLRILEKIID